MSIIENLKTIKSSVSDAVCLVAVSKTKPISSLESAFSAGQLDFGENKVQELCMKAEKMSKDIRWHMIGHLQRNKVKYIAPFIHLIHGVDSLRLLKEINKQGAQNRRVISCLLQLHIASESSKFGLSFEEAKQILAQEIDQLPFVRVQGLMGMASFTDDKQQIKNEFKGLSDFYHSIKKKHRFQWLSMGMSADYPLAIQMGSNMIRVGSNIFGKRNYT